MVAPLYPSVDEELPEYDEEGEEMFPDLVDAEKIRDGLGDFRKLIYQPTLYGARYVHLFMCWDAQLTSQ